MHPKRWSNKRVGRLTPRVGPEGRRHGTQSQGQGIWGSGRGESARETRPIGARAGRRRRQRGAAAREAAERAVRPPDGCETLTETLLPSGYGFLVSKH